MAAGGETSARKLTAGDSLRIIHVMRAPVGGLFRHVVDLARAQAQAGHLVGIVADSDTGGEPAERALAELVPQLALGLQRMPIHRLPHPNDFVAAWRIARLLKLVEPDVVHGHGAKGGLYARLPALLPFYPKPANRVARVYTPHGGSLHYAPERIGGQLFLLAERAMAGVTDFIPFESEFALRRFNENVGAAPALTSVVHNGLAPWEFESLTPRPDAADFLFIGEFRYCKGVDTLIAALAAIGGDVRLALVGSGPDEADFRAYAEKLGVSARIVFHPPAKGREALRLGRILVAPSRAESLPYIVLETIAAGVPVVASQVGGVPEIFGAQAHRLVPPEDVTALTGAMTQMLAMPSSERESLAKEMAADIETRFTIERMVDGVLRGYRKALAAGFSAAISPLSQFKRETE